MNILKGLGNHFLCSTHSNGESPKWSVARVSYWYQLGSRISFFQKCDKLLVWYCKSLRRSYTLPFKKCDVPLLKLTNRAWRMEELGDLRPSPKREGVQRFLDWNQILPLEVLPFVTRPSWVLYTWPFQKWKTWPPFGAHQVGSRMEEAGTLFI